MVTLHFKQLNVPPGGRIILTDVNWSKFEEILQELGEKRLCSLAAHQLNRTYRLF